MQRYFVVIIFVLISQVIVCADEYVYVYKNGQIIFQQKAERIDSISAENNILEIFNKEGKILFSAEEATIDSITFDYKKPIADVLDIVFHADGTVTDESPMGNVVEACGINGISSYPYYDNGRYNMRFDNPKSGTAKSYYKVDYEQNSVFKQALADGHSIEAVFMMTETPYSSACSEAKFFASHQGGGTGLSVKDGEICFLPNVSQTGKSNYVKLYSGIRPQENVFYHVVAVWNKEEGKEYIYVNGDLKGEMDAVGNLKWGSAGSQWFGIGCDAKNATDGEMAWNGDVRIARIYDKPLNQNDVTVLWNNYNDERESNPNLVNHVEFFSGLPVTKGQGYEFSGEGFKDADYIRFTPLTGRGSTFVKKIALISDNMAQIKLPTSIRSGLYSVELIRQGAKQLLGHDSIVVVDKFPKVFDVRFHRGFWNTPGSAQDSRTSLQKAIENNARYSETDIWLTSDDSIVALHDASLNGVTIQTSTYDQVKNLTLPNGEKLPLLRDILKILATSTETSISIETKKHSTTQRTIEASRKVMELVKEMGLQGQVEYNSFSLDACMDLRQHDSTAIISYINGDRTPEWLDPYGININYSADILRKNPQWVSNAHALGRRVASWTLNTRETIVEIANMEVDILTSDYPLWAQKIREYYIRHQNE